MKKLLLIVALLSATLGAQSPGTIDAVDEVVTFETGGVGTVGIQITGTYSGTLSFQGTIDGTNYVAIRAYPTTSSTAETFTTTTGVWTAGSAGMLKVRVYGTALASGAAVITMRAHVGSGGNSGAAVASGAEDPPLPGAGVGASYLESGGQVIWTSALAFRVQAGVAWIDGNEVTFTEQTITLSAADGSNPRIDVIAVNTSGTIVKINGTAAASPSLPTIDPGTQLQLAFVTVAAAATTPTVTDTLLYAENVGSAVEWNCTDSGTGFVCNGSTNPHGGTVSIVGTAVPAADYIQLEIGTGTVDPNAYRLLYCYVRPTAAWASGNGLQFTLRQTNIQRGNIVVIDRTKMFGFDHTLISYQLVAIPITTFAVPAGSLINQVRIAKFGSGATLGVTIDDCTLQSGGSSQFPTGITQTQADARYPLLSDYAEVNLGTVGSTETINWNSRYISMRRMILDENLTLTFSNPVVGGRYMLIFTQDGSGTNTVTWPANVEWTAGAAPTITATASATTLCTLAYTGVGSAGYLAACNLNYAF